MTENFLSAVTPIKLKATHGLDRGKRFVRKQDGKSQRLTARQSEDNQNLMDMYIKSPGLAGKRPHTQSQDFFASLASSIIKMQDIGDRKGDLGDQYQSEKTDRTTFTSWEDMRETKIQMHEQTQTTIQKLSNRVRTLEASLQLKTHEAGILSNECQQLKKTVDKENEKRKKSENDRKQAYKQLKKWDKQKQHLTKQIHFLQQITYDDKTRDLQSYRQTYLEQQVQKIRKQFQKSRQQRQHELDNQIKNLQQQKFAIQSHLKATKVANQCLVKQINNFQQALQDIIINSDEYKKLRDKYIRLLEEYKFMRNQYWTLKTELHQKQGGSSVDSSGIFSITTSEVDNNISELKPSHSSSNLLQNKGSTNYYASWFQ